MKLYLGTGEVFDLNGIGASFELRPLDFGEHGTMPIKDSGFHVNL